jgi:hypothetical protein
MIFHFVYALESKNRLILKIYISIKKDLCFTGVAVFIENNVFVVFSLNSALPLSFPRGRCNRDRKIF